MQLRFPASTGQAANLLGVLEPRLNDLVRRGKIHPAPCLFAGRRAWSEFHIRQAAEILGILDIDGLLAASTRGKDGDDPR